MTFFSVPRIARYLVLLTMLAPLATRGATDPPKRIALVIGIGTYHKPPPLKNAVGDARAIGQALQRLQFDVTELYNPDLTDLNKAIREFGIHAASTDVAVVYYAGHGIQVSKENYLVPVDAKLEHERDVQYETVPLERLLSELSQASHVGILLLDSCRNNPFTERAAQPASVAARTVVSTQGLARIDDVPRNTLVIMAAKADHVADDGEEHSPFAAALVEHFKIPGLEIGFFSRSVRDFVLRATANRQEPYMFSSLGADPFYFYPRPPNRPPAIGPINALDVADSAGPTPLGLPEPSDPDQDPLTVRISGLPRLGAVLFDGHAVAINAVMPVERLKTAAFKPDGTGSGPAGTLDIVIEDGRGGSVAASLPITVRQTTVQAAGSDKPAPPKPPVPAGVTNVALNLKPIWDLSQQQAADASHSSRAQRLDVDVAVDHGNQTYRLGEPVTVSVRPHLDAYVTVLNYGTSGRMTVVFPNQFQPDNRIHAGQIVEIPPNGAAFRLTPAGPAGVELLQVVASDQPLSLPEVARLGMQQTNLPFVSFGRSAAEVAHDLTLQLSAQSPDAPVSVSKVLAVRVTPDANGALFVRTDKNVYHTGEPVQITVIARETCALRLLAAGSSGVVSQLFPNSGQPATPLMPGQVLTVPPPDGGLRFVAGKTAGIETVFGLCSPAGSSSETPITSVLTRRNEAQAAAAYFVTE